MERLGKETQEKVKGCTAVTATGLGVEEQVSLGRVVAANFIVEQEQQQKQGVLKEDRGTS